MIRYSRPEAGTVHVLAAPQSVRVQFGTTTKPDREDEQVLLIFPEIVASDGTTVIKDQVDVTIPLKTLQEWVARLQSGGRTAES